jgi:ATP-dependent Clp protease ATP-binding subunit ClpA
MLLGLVRGDDNVACKVLKALGIEPSDIRSEALLVAQKGDEHLGEDMQLSGTSKRVIDLSYSEAKELGNDFIGTEHLLLALSRESGSLGAKILDKFGFNIDLAREHIKTLQEVGAKVSTAPSAQPQQAIGNVWYLTLENARVAQEVPGTEHILLALLKSEGDAATVLANLGITLEAVEQEIRKLRQA